MPYAYAPPSTTPVELSGGFTTANGTQYPAHVLDLWSNEELKAVHVYEIIEPDPTPEGKRVVSLTLQRKTGPVRVERVATYEDITLDEVKTAKKDQADRLCDDKMAAGYDHDFGGTVGVKRLQTRESDRPYWLALASVAQSAIMMGTPNASVGSIRTEDNTNVPVTASEALAAMMGMQAHLGVILGTLWAIKDAISAATNAAEVAAIDLSPLE